MRFLKKISYISYAPVDIKKAVVYLRDGYDNGANTPTSTDIEPIAETDIALTAMNSAVPDPATTVGVSVKFGTDDQEYTVDGRTLAGGTDEVQTGTVGGAWAAGTFTLSFGGEVTAAIAFDASGAEVELALEALDTVPNGTITVAETVALGAGVGELTFTFTGALEGNQEMLVEDVAGIGGGTFTIVETTPGVLGGSTSAISITPGLVVATTAGGTVTFGGRRLEIKVGEGNLTYDESLTRDYILNRGNLDTVRDGDDVPVDVSWDFVWDFLTAVGGSAIPTIEEVLKQSGEASTWLTSSADPCEPYCVDIEVYYDPGCGGDNTELIVLPYFRYEKLTHNLRDSQVSCSGKCNAEVATITRGA